MQQGFRHNLAVEPAGNLDLEHRPFQFLTCEASSARGTMACAALVARIYLDRERNAANLADESLVETLVIVPGQATLNSVPYFQTFDQKCWVRAQCHSRDMVHYSNLAWSRAGGPVHY
jgi:hypothetical protein